MIIDKLNTSADLQPSIASKQYKLQFRCIEGQIVVVKPFGKIGKVGIQVVFNILIAICTPGGEYSVIWAI